MVYEAPNYGTYFKNSATLIQELAQTLHNYDMHKRFPGQAHKLHLKNAGQLKHAAPMTQYASEEEREAEQEQLPIRLPRPASPLPRPGKAQVSVASTHPAQTRPAPLRSTSK